MLVMMWEFTVTSSVSLMNLYIKAKIIFVFWKMYPSSVSLFPLKKHCYPNFRYNVVTQLILHLHCDAYMYRSLALR
jgi:hypothetical protein